MKNLSKEFETIVNKYIKIFENKHDLEFEYWIGDIVGEIACFGDYFFNFSEIKLDVEMNIPEETIIEWFDYNISNISEDNYSINYRTWLKLHPEKLLTDKK